MKFLIAVAIESALIALLLSGQPTLVEIGAFLCFLACFLITLATLLNFDAMKIPSNWKEWVSQAGTLALDACLAGALYIAGHPYIAVWFFVISLPIITSRSKP